MRCRITSSTIETYGRLAEEEIPAGDLEQRTTSMRKASFKQWLSDPEKLVYNDELSKAWNNLKQKQAELSTDRNRITALILGEPLSNYEDAKKHFCFLTCLYLYNRWKSDASFNFVQIDRLVKENTSSHEDAFSTPDQEVTLLDALYSPSLAESLKLQFKNILAFDALYNNIVTCLLYTSPSPRDRG